MIRVFESGRGWYRVSVVVAGLNEIESDEQGEAALKRSFCCFYFTLSWYLVAFIFFLSLLYFSFISVFKVKVIFALDIAQ